MKTGRAGVKDPWKSYAGLEAPTIDALATKHSSFQRGPRTYWGQDGQGGNRYLFGFAHSCSFVAASWRNGGEARIRIGDVVMSLHNTIYAV